MQSSSRVAAILVSSRPRSTIKALEKRLGCVVTIDQMGAQEFIVSVVAEILDKFCSSVKAVRKRRLSPENERAFVESGRATRIKSAGDTGGPRFPEGQRIEKQ